MPAKKSKVATPRKKKSSASAKRGTPVSAKVPPVPPLSSLRISPSQWMFVLLGLFIASWLLCMAGHYPKAEKVFLIVSILTGASYLLKLNNIKQVLIVIGLGWVLAALAIGVNPNFIYAFSFLGNFAPRDPIAQFAIGMGLLIAFWRYLPSGATTPELSKTWARIWFWGIFAAAVYFRMYKVHEPAGIFWDDPSVGITDPRGIVEFHEHPMLMPIANREPFYSYFLAGLWSLMPDAYAIFVQRLGCGLIDLAAVWLFYLLGKEVGGRRVGLVAMALGAYSKPMIIASLICFTNVTVAMAVALVLLMTLRLFKNPSWKHFIYWGLSLGFMPYTYTAVRPWPLFIVTAVFLWMWFYKEKNKRDGPVIALGWGTMMTWAYCFLMVNNFLPKQSAWVDFLSRGWIGLAVLAALWVLFYLTLRSEKAVKGENLFPRFFLAVFVAALVVYPLVIQPLFSAHPSNLSIFHNRDNLTLHIGSDALKMFMEKISESLKTLFVWGDDRGDMNLPDEAFFEYHFIPVFILGLASLLVRPTWTKIFLLIAGFVGISPHILSIDPHSGKLLGGVAPLAVLAGLGFQQLYSGLKTAAPGKFSNFWIIPLLALYFGWAVWGTDLKVLRTFFTGDRVEKTISNQVKQYSLTGRVYIASYPLFVSSGVQAVLDQGYDVYSLGDENPIFVKPNEQPGDVVVLMHIYDKITQTKIEQQFKNVAWETIYLGGWKDKRPACRRAIIPAAEIPEKPGKIFRVEKVPATYWRRDYLMGRYIFTYGVIELQESVPNPYVPIPKAMGGRMVNLKGSFSLPSSSRVTFKVSTNDYVKLVIDGRKILSLAPDWAALTASKTVELSGGEHQVIYDIYLQHDQFIPQLQMSVEGGTQGPLGL